MSLLAIPYPAIDPVLVEFGPFSIGGWTSPSLPIRWYSLAYIAGFIVAWWLVKRLVARPQLWRDGRSPFDKALVDDAIVYAALSGILGGRLFYVFVYNWDHFRDNLASIPMVWEGGMAFHGGIAGCVLGLLMFAWRTKTPFLTWLDLTAVAAPIGIALGRIANFIKPELWGRLSDAPWAMVFPGAGDAPRHPSQLYQMMLEGWLLFIILFAVARGGGLKRPGFVAGCFAIGYGLARSVGEMFREPDPQLGFLWGGATMGQLLNIPLVIIGLVLIVRSRKEA